MRKTHVVALSLAILGLALSGATAGAQEGSGIEGVWQDVKVERLGADGWVIDYDLPSLYIFHDGYYSRMVVLGQDRKAPEPRKVFADADNVSDAAKVEAYETLGANTGTYEVSGAEITFKVVLAKNPNFRNWGGDGTYTQRFKVEGDVLTVEQMVGDTEYRLTRKRLK